MARMLALGSMFTVVLAAMGCADPTEDVTQDTSELAANGCGANYRVAFEHYKNAVDWSKERLRASSVCDWDNGYQWDIANEASRAVMSCGEFRNIIRTSPWAEPLREVLRPTLNLRSFTGELLVIRDSEWQNWTGVERFFEEGGLKFFANAQGAYGPPVRVTFGENGTATWSQLVHDDQTGFIDLETQEATFTIERSGATEAGPRIVRIVHDGQEDVFSLGVENPWNGYKDSPRFVLQPLGNGDVLGEGTSVPALYSLVTECDA